MELTKGIISVLCSFTAASSAISIASAFSSANTPTNSDPMAEYSTAYENELVYSEERFLYTLKETSGNIGVFDAYGNLIEIIEVPVVTLPINERDRLKAGFAVKDKAELNKLKEAYSG